MTMYTVAENIDAYVRRGNMRGKLHRDGSARAGCGRANQALLH